MRPRPRGPGPARRAPNLGARESLPPNLVGEDVGGRLAASGTFSDVIEATDAAGNTAKAQRHQVRVL